MIRIYTVNSYIERMGDAEFVNAINSDKEYNNII